MLKKILAIMGRDTKSGMRDYMILYILVVPFLIAVILNMLTSSVSQSILRFAVDDTVTEEEISYFTQYAKVEEFESEEVLLERVEALDDVYGITKDANGFQVVTQGNEKVDMQEMAVLLLDSLSNEDIEVPVTLTVSDVGWKLSPIKQYGGSLLAVFISIFGGMIILINLVEEKQENTLAAMNVAPVNRIQYVLGKAALGFLIPLVHVIGILLILDYGSINYFMAALVTVSIALTSVIIGFTIGVNSDNVLAAISGMKMVFLPVLGSIFGAIYLREGLHFLLYWSPFYWAFMAMDSIILKEAAWGSILFSTLMILLISSVVMLAMRKKINRGLK
ncbi:ABC transporter permease [Proteiniclasticum sp. SCR006]|uniref:ABC transporter permease n=1 Tax=Proteiniclasticum aestuarii TaxID=2817862 RepID=A0A939HA14_9CLOT|nr:ABC transporter permease [Proteiniclasticum aestuarii]MBO1264221.1 ABC transporter permease [Proteiniclasticum aestuarii]